MGGTGVNSCSVDEGGGGRGIAYVMRVVGGALKKTAVTPEMSDSAGT